jgi:hypothetical protein
MVKTRLVAIIFTCVLATTGWAETPSPSLIATPPQPKWSELTVKQKIVLAPLSDDWDSMEYFRQKKWLGIAARFPEMTPEEQRRIQGQMQAWGKLTPEQRQLARENFKTANQLPAEKKQELKQKWEEYSSLPEDEKEKLKQQAASKPVPKPGRPTATAPLLPAPAAMANPVAPPSTPLTPLPTAPPAPEASPPAVAPASAETTSKP